MCFIFVTQLMIRDRDYLLPPFESNYHTLEFLLLKVSGLSDVVTVALIFISYHPWTYHTFKFSVMVNQTFGFEPFVSHYSQS